jgi:hypothetical protein
VIAVMAMVIAVLVFLLVRGTSSTSDRAPAPGRDPSAAGFARRGGRAGDHGPPPSLRRNELGQPLDEDGRPIGPPAKLRQLRNRPLEPGDVPLVPPLFDDAGDRARFKQWWVDEMGRRVRVFEGLEPREGGYPTEDQTRRLLDDYYDAIEPRGPDESVDSAYARRQAWRRLWQQFLDDYGAPIKTVSSRGGDPQHGPTPDPPVAPPGVPEPDPEPAPESEPPPGRGPDDPGGLDPVPGETGSAR